jgi:hypothetical protein
MVQRPNQQGIAAGVRAHLTKILAKRKYGAGSTGFSLKIRKKELYQPEGCTPNMLRTLTTGSVHEHLFSCSCSLDSRRRGT